LVSTIVLKDSFYIRYTFLVFPLVPKEKPNRHGGVVERGMRVLEVQRSRRMAGDWIAKSEKICRFFLRLMKIFRSDDFAFAFSLLLEGNKAKKIKRKKG